MISRDNILNLEVRQQIYDFIKNNPGLHQRELSRRMNIPKSTILYHIRFLKKLNLIDENKGYNNKYYCVARQVGIKEKQIINLFRKQIPCKIFLYTLFSLSCSKVELSRELELPYTTVVRNINKMLKTGIIEEAPKSKSRVYPFPRAPNTYVEIEPIKSEKFYRRASGEIIDLAWTILIAHKDDLVDKEFLQAHIDYLIGLDWKFLKSDGNFTEDYEDYNRSYKKTYVPKKYQRIDSIFDSVINMFNDVFRPPFCA